MHYKRVWRHGDINTVFPTIPAVDRFWEFVEKTEGCWVWTGATIKKGYGRFYVERGHYEAAHRFSYELHVGPIPDGLCVLHKCDNPPCVRPDHLFPGTKADNNRDMAAKGRRRWTQAFINSKKTPHKGSAHWMARLTDGDVIAIRKFRSEGQSLKQLSKTFCVSEAHISRIALRKVWAHLGDHHEVEAA